MADAVYILNQFLNVDGSWVNSNMIMVEGLLES